MNIKVKIDFRMSKFDIRPEFECQNRISNVKIRYGPEFEICQILNRISIVTQNEIFGLNSNVKIGMVPVRKSN